MYAEFVTDPKVQMLTEAEQRRYVMLLCLRCGSGDVTLQDSEVAFQLRISPDEWLETKAILTSKNLITDGNQPTAWEKRQYTSDSSTARVSKYREKKKRTCNVTETPPDTETETDKTPSTTDVVLSASEADDAGGMGDMPNCPHQQIIDLYGELLPEQPQPRSWDGQRAKNLKARWRWVLTAKRKDGQRYATTEAEGLGFFRRLFIHIRSSDFMMRQWTGWDLGWIVKAVNFEKIIAGNYDSRKESA